MKILKVVLLPFLKKKIEHRMKIFNIILLALVVLTNSQTFSKQQKIDIYDSFFAHNQLHKYRSEWKSIMFSSYDRSGGNDDGFNGTYSKLRSENGNSVIAEVEGCGYLSRIWMPHGRHLKKGKIIDGILNNENERILIYIDGENTPSINVSLRKLFNGKIEEFPNNLVGKGLGGFYSYVPIPFSKSCKVTITGKYITFHQIGFQLYQGGKVIKSYRNYKKESIKRKLNDVNENIRINSNSTNIGGILNTESNNEFVLIQKDGIIKNLKISTDNRNFEKLLNSTIEINFDNAKEPQIKTQVKNFFATADSQSLFRSIVSGFDNGALYFTLPMPFKSEAKIQIKTKEKFSLSLMAQLEVEKQNKMGYLHTFSNYQPNLEDKNTRVNILDIKGQGHYVGVFFSTQGKTKGKEQLPLWLEGDEVFEVDGEMTIHGTGTEDYFNCGWYSVPGRLNNPGAFLFHGFPQFKMGKTGKASAYRWHLTDPVSFNKQIKINFEHGPKNDYPASYNTTAFYYLFQN